MAEHIALFITECMNAMGYAGLVLMMALESMIAPVPSEIVMPFAGFLVERQDFTFWGAVVASSLGTILGSLLSYAIGRFGGYPLVYRFGPYLLLERHHLESTVAWFHKHGEITILISRFVPVVRHLISIPAGVGRMNLVRFSAFTLIGGTIWNTILLVAGVHLGKHWEIIHKYSQQVDYVCAAAIVVVVAWWAYKQWLRLRQRSAERS